MDTRMPSRARAVAKKAKLALERAKLMAAEVEVVAKRAKLRLKTSRKARAAAIVGATAAAVAIGAVALKRRAKR